MLQLDFYPHPHPHCITLWPTKIPHSLSELDRCNKAGHGWTASGTGQLLEDRTSMMMIMSTFIAHDSINLNAQCTLGGWGGGGDNNSH